MQSGNRIASFMAEFSLHKSEKLCGHTAINRLFANGLSAKSYPLRAVYAFSGRTDGARAQFLISVPKKKIRKAVGRVQVRRRIRESYRLNRRFLLPSLENAGMKADIAFIYLSDEIKDYALIEQKMQRVLESISCKAAELSESGAK